MKKLLFSAALFAVSLSTSFAQITVAAFETPVMTGAVVYPLFQGMAGNMSVEGTAIPKVTGSFSSATIDAILTLSTLDTYANDFTILVTSIPEVATADILLQVGGFSAFSNNKVDWSCTGDCDTNTIGTPLDATAAFAALDFTNSTYVIWFANGWANGQAGNPSTNTGQWNIESLTLGGTLALGSVSIEENKELTAVAYPNPATDKLNITVDGDEVLSVSVLSVDGKVISTNDGSIVQVADLTAGVYFYEARTAAGAVLRNSFVKK